MMRLKLSRERWGLLGGRLGKRLRRGALGGLGVLLLALVAAWWTPLPQRLDATPSTVVSYRDGSPAHVFLSSDDKARIEVDPASVDPDYLAALLRFEDKRFRLHPGVDPLAIARAMRLNFQAGRVVSGGSTLTMQLVRVLEPRPRNLRSKVLEALRAVQLELHLSKDEILAAYLSFIPFGRNLEGLEAASWSYFGHSASDLAEDEIAVLLAVPQRPTQRFPTPDNADALRAGRDEVAQWLVGEGIFTGDALDRVLAASLPRELRPLPRSAPHAARYFWRLSGEATQIATTLDRGMQETAERLLSGAHRGLENLGIHNGSVVVLDHQTSELRALVGNVDFWDDEHGGQILGFATPRSPGSALKPFLYALAIDRGLALPGHLVSDVPTVWSGYAPSNYDGTFNGMIELEEALSRSLNIPFVELLDRIGVERFVGLLRQAGVKSLRGDPGFYGLSTALGGLEISPLELAGLYAALAANGVFRAAVWRAEESVGEGIPFVAPGAAQLTRRALARRDRPDFPERRRFAGVPARIHWKTGTSYGHRDAWAAGSDARHTAVVWWGNFDREPSVDLVGADVAGPVLFDLLEALGERSKGAWRPPPSPDLTRIEVCTLSGRLPNSGCPFQREVSALRHRVPTERCALHVEVDVDLATGLALNPTCRAGRSWEPRVFTVWPAATRRWLAEHHRHVPAPPSLAPECRATGEGPAPIIRSPPAGQILVLVPGADPASQEVPLIADGAGGALSWFVDGLFLGMSEGDEPVWWTPSPGRHRFVVTDESGRSARRELQVRRPP